MFCSGANEESGGDMEGSLGAHLLMFDCPVLTTFTQSGRVVEISSSDGLATRTRTLGT